MTRRGQTKAHNSNTARGMVGNAGPGLEANALDPHLRGAVRGKARMQAYCVCGRSLMPTTPADVRAGVQPRCPSCPKEAS